MTTTETALPSQFSALSIAADAASTLSSSSSTSSPQGKLPGNDNGGGVPQGVNFGAGAAATKAWRAPPGRAPGREGAAFMEERSSPSPWPVPSRGGAQGKKKLPQCSEKELFQTVLPSPRPSGTPRAAATAAAAAGPSSSLEPDQKEMETWEEQPRASDPVAVAPHRTELPPPMVNNNSRTPRPPSLPTFRQQQWRAPQSGRRARNLQQFPHHHNNGSGSGSHQQRPHRHWNTLPSHQRPANNGYYHPMNQGMMGLPSLPPGWGFNTMPVLQHGPSPHLAPPPGGMFSHGPFSGPYLPEAFPYAAPPVSPILPPHPGWRPPWLTTPPARPPAEAPLPSAQHQQHPVENPQQEGEGVDVRLRRQIEYYFSDENLIKDVYLRRCMDDQGWVSIHTIAGFPRVKSLTGDIGLVLGALRTSVTLEVSMDKVRRKSEWGKWII